MTLKQQPIICQNTILPTLGNAQIHILLCISDNGKIHEDENHLLHMSNFHNWNMDHNPKGMSQTIQLPNASQYPYLEQERNTLSGEIKLMIGNLVDHINLLRFKEAVSSQSWNLPAVLGLTWTQWLIVLSCLHLWGGTWKFTNLNYINYGEIKF